MFGMVDAWLWLKRSQLYSLVCTSNIIYQVVSCNSTSFFLVDMSVGHVVSILSCIKVYLVGVMPKPPFVAP